MKIRIPVSDTLIINTLSCAIGALAAYNAAILWKYRSTLYQLWKETVQCLTSQ